MTYAADRAWSDRFLPQIKRIVGPWLVDATPELIDQREGADLMILKARDLRIAARVRAPGYADRFPFDFTIRLERDSGATTEFRKIAEGFGDWMFYGHAGAGNIIERWMLIDLAVFRYALIATSTRKRVRRGIARRSNGDGTHLLAYNIRYFPPTICIASSHEIPFLERVA